MSEAYSLLPEVSLYVEGRISAEDAARQKNTAREILKRLATQPGVILADEVGMGKTFVALAAGVSIALQNRGRRPIVVMVPSSLKEKWPGDFAVFVEKCLPANVAGRLSCGRAERAVQFLKLLDDPPTRRKSVIFLTHGAMSRGLNDHWVMLALIRQAVSRRKGIDQLRRALCRSMADLLQMKWVERYDHNIWQRLLATPPADWLAVMYKTGVIQEGVGSEEEDDPVPKSILDVVPHMDTAAVFDALHQIPLRKSKHYNRYIVEARHVIKQEIRELWKACLSKTSLRLPLLVLDEAHHLKNADTRLASLFRSVDARDDAEEISRGPLGAVFERMLFLTATPFQLGHSELCSVLERFDGICWKGANVPSCGRDGFHNQTQTLRVSLDAAQEAAVTLDHAWGHLKEKDLSVGEHTFHSVDGWWAQARQGDVLTPAAADAVRCFERAKDQMKLAESQLMPWVIRHLKPRHLPGIHAGMLRRRRFVGRAIRLDVSEDDHRGLAVSGDALLPFLLAIRATSYAPDSRPVFAEGLASSYEAFLHTRRGKSAEDGKLGIAIDADDDDASVVLHPSDTMNWYLNHLESLIPRDGSAELGHPKVSATVSRAVDIWKRGEKVVIFCHYIATGRILRQRMSDAIQAEIRSLGAEKLRCMPENVDKQLDLLGKRFFDEDSPIRRACDVQAEFLISEFPELQPHSNELTEIVRRNVRTPSFLVRYFPIDRETLDEESMQHALDSPDLSGMTLRGLLRQFFSFLVDRCGELERGRYIEAVKKIQTGSHFGVAATTDYEDDELQGAKPEQLMPNVRLVNGRTRSETRQRLMLTFNTPFYPEILVASSVMAEGVDLHLNCRYVLHHDLCWNPSTLEQRSGRVDRIGAKAEAVGQPIHIYIPFVAETQDEKMYRVVMDRERWFSVVMGENYKIDVRTTEKLADRVPFPIAGAEELAFDLRVASNDMPT